MIEARVRVVSQANGLTWVEPTEQSGCGGCQARSSCGVGGLSKVFRLSRAPIAVNCGEARAGEELVLSLDEADLLKASLLAYLLPAVLAIVGAALLAAQGDVAAVIAALAGALGGLLIARMLSRAPRISARRAHTCSI
jgi:sigma-E factor negative regulatory protein RseC